MIVAVKRRRFSAWFARHAEKRLRRTFDRTLVAGARTVVELARTRPLLIVANHSAWWDALMVLVLSERVLGLDGHALMNAANLRRLRFFALTGAIGVELDDPRDGARAIRHGARLLDRPGRALWMFPQGRERPLHEPLAFRPGASRIVRLAPGATVVPLALVYAFGEAPRPIALASFGPPIHASSQPERIDVQRAAVMRELDRIAAWQSGNALDVFEQVVSGRPSRLGAWASIGLDRIAGWLLEHPAGTDPKRALPPAYAPGPQRAHEGQQQ